MNIPTLEKSASMAYDVFGTKTGGARSSTSASPKEPAETATPPNSPTGVWDLSFLFGNSASQGDDTSIGSAEKSILSQQNVAPVPERLVDFFCVVGPKLDAIRDFAEKPKDVNVEPKLLDCYPKSRTDHDFPAELPSFCLPNGCHLSTEKNPPTLATFILTSSAGNRLYGTVLTMYEVVPLEDLCEAFWQGECILPAWIEEPRPFYLPKCLVVISHHAFYDVQRTFLSQLYRIACCGKSPLPLERYVANFVHDIPLPRQGAATISWTCFTKDTKVRYRRPAPNELPLINYSYKPIFRCLSVSNILTIWGILLQEGRVVLQSENQALLTPVAEALTSFLFPFTWQGMYIPVLPSNMMDLLEAPLPFLIGFVGRTCPQPPGVVTCDLDQDIVNLGTDEYGQSRILPQLPKPLITNLKLELEEIADPLYLIPPCGIKGRITSAFHGLLENYMRESYAHQVEMRELSLSNTHRHFILTQANILPQSKPLISADFVLYDQERTMYRSRDKAKKPKNRREGNNIFKALKRQSRAIQSHPGRKYVLSEAAAERYDETMEKNKHSIASALYQVDDDLTSSVRYIFLRFFSTLLMRYKDFAKNGTFRYDDFLRSLNEITHGSRLFVESMLKTQMFERFLVESSTRRRLFDEHVLVQLNESILTKKQETPFLDEQHAVQKIIEPASPCTAGLARGQVFEYDNFPQLADDQFVAYKNLDPISALCYLGSDVLCGLEW